MPDALQKTVTIIPPAITKQENNKKKGPLRVAAYCRVSTDDEEQLTSYKNQIGYYTQKITDNPNWILVKIYADEGLSGTSTKRRPQFNQMMTSCRRGRIDLIITKSVSRFARNTVDCLKYVRMLKELEVAVLFEKENINTLEIKSELMLAFYGGFAQSESESISANVAWGKRKSFKDGKVIFHYNKLLGYRRGEDGEPEIVPQEAEIVRRIYRTYLAGKSAMQIAEDLMRDGIAPPRKSADWKHPYIINILKNEKYSGDAILQKTYISDCLTKKVKKNNGELPMYLVQNNHPAIVSRELFNRVQEEMARRNSKPKTSVKATKTNNGRFSCKYALTEIMTCAECGAPYRRVTWTSRGQRRIVWRCLSRLESGKKTCKDSPTILEPVLHDAILHCIQQQIRNKNDILQMIQNTVASAIVSTDGPGIETLEQMIAERNDEIFKLIERGCKDEASEDALDKKCLAISMEIRNLRAQQELLGQSQQPGNNDNRMTEIVEALNIEDIRLDEYDNRLVRKVIESISILSKNKIMVTFKNGDVLEINLTVGSCQDQPNTLH